MIYTIHSNHSFLKYYNICLKFCKDSNLVKILIKISLLSSKRKGKKTCLPLFLLIAVVKGVEPISNFGVF